MNYRVWFVPRCLVPPCKAALTSSNLCPLSLCVGKLIELANALPWPLFTLKPQASVLIKLQHRRFGVLIEYNKKATVLRLVELPEKKYRPAC